VNVGRRLFHQEKYSCPTCAGYRVKGVCSGSHKRLCVADLWHCGTRCCHQLTTAPDRTHECDRHAGGIRMLVLHFQTVPRFEHLQARLCSAGCCAADANAGTILPAGGSACKTLAADARPLDCSTFQMFCLHTCVPQDSALLAAPAGTIVPAGASAAQEPAGQRLMPLT
jgi:hypothetical protein